MKKVISFIIAIVAILGVYNTINLSNAIATSSDLKNKTVQIGGQPFGIKFYSEGALVTKVRENSPADKAGMRVNDIIIGINNEKVKELGYKDTFTVEEGLTHTVEILKEVWNL